MVRRIRGRCWLSILFLQQAVGLRREFVVQRNLGQVPIIERIPDDPRRKCCGKVPAELLVGLQLPEVVSLGQAETEMALAGISCLAFFIEYFEKQAASFVVNDAKDNL